MGSGDCALEWAAGEVGENSTKEKERGRESDLPRAFVVRKKQYVWKAVV